MDRSQMARSWKTRWGLLQQPVGTGQGQALVPRQRHQLLCRSLLRRGVLFFRFHSIKCRSHHGTLPAELTPGASGRKHRLMHSPALTACADLQPSAVDPRKKARIRKLVVPPQNRWF